MQYTQRLLVIGKVWPEPESSAAGWRMLQILSAFQSLNYQIHFASAATKGPYSADLESRGIAEDQIHLNDASFDAYVRALQPKIVVFDRFTSEEQYGWRITEQLPETLQILDTEDLHSLREARQRAFKEQRELQPSDLQSPIALRELASIYRADLSLIISGFEKDLLTGQLHVPSQMLHYLPLLSATMGDSRAADWSTRQHFISIGNFLHAPNLDAVTYLNKEIWPLIRKALPSAELHIYGAYTPEQVRQWHKPSNGFLVKDRAEDAALVMGQARVCLAPLRFGAGQKGKLLLAMECGTVSVTSSIGAEGMHQGLDWPGAIADTAEDFAASAVRLYRQEQDWQKAQKAIPDLLNHHAPQPHLGQFKYRLNELLRQLPLHRANNYTGALLRQSAFQSTRYMSLWITAKNQIAATENNTEPNEEQGLTTKGG